MIYKLVIHKRAAIEAKNIAIYIRDILCNPQAAKNFVRAMEEEKPSLPFCRNQKISNVLPS